MNKTTFNSKLDRLMAMAAKAARLDVHKDADGVWRFKSGNEWAPLSFASGDALALATSLQLVLHNRHLSEGRVFCASADGQVRHPDVEVCSDNPSAITPNDHDATRMAILLAAAQIGEAMP